VLCIDPVHWNMKRARPDLSFRPEQPWGPAARDASLGAGCARSLHC
jgi:hypothetical protein